MTSEEVGARVIKCIAQVLALDLVDVRPESRLMDDLGAESLDLVELMYVLEHEFGIRMEQKDMSLTAQLGLKDEEIHEQEVLTPRALEALKDRFPWAHDLLKPGITRKHLAALLTVAEVTRAVERKIASTGADPLSTATS